MKSLIEQGKLLSLSFPVLVALWEQVETFLDAFQIIVKHRPSLCVAPTALDVRMQPTHPSRLSRFAGSPSGWANLWARLTAARGVAGFRSVVEAQRFASSATNSRSRTLRPEWSGL